VVGFWLDNLGLSVLLTNAVYFSDILFAYHYNCGSFAAQELVLPAFLGKVTCPVFGRKNKLIKFARSSFCGGPLTY
jgi:hypothetical protein